MGDQKTSDKGIKAITQREGEVLKGYKDSKGLLTVGVGHLVKPGEPYKLNQPITREESQRLLREDLTKFEFCVNTNVHVPLNQNQFDALVSFAFNIGTEGFKRSTVLKKLNRKDYAGAAQAMMNWAKPPEIAGRRRTEVKQFLTPMTGNDKPKKFVETEPTETKETTVIATPAGKETTEAITKNEQDVNKPAVVSAAQYQGVGFIGALKKDIAAVGGGNLGLQSLQEYATQASGWPEWIVAIVVKAATVSIVLGSAWLLFRFGHYLVWKWGERDRLKTTAHINSDVTRKDVEWY